MIKPVFRRSTRLPLTGHHKDTTLSGRLGLLNEINKRNTRLPLIKTMQIKPAFRPSLQKLATVITKYDRTVVHIVGHTDSTGPSDYNQRLSERRAESVESYLVNQGVSRARLHTEGRGEFEPRDTNSTEAGRQLNRRVEIFIKPVVEGKEHKAHESPKY